MRRLRPCFILIAMTGLLNHLSAQESTPASTPGSTQAITQDYKLAIGIRFSSAAPTLSNSVTVKYFMNERDALEGLISFGNRFGIGGLYERHQLIGATPAFTWFYGIGGYIGFQNNNTYLGPTGAVGLDYKFPNAPLNLSLDRKPELDIIPAINFVPDAFGFSARFTF
jgi:hypothetical protein